MDRSRGQATVEFALLIPVFVLAIWILVAIAMGIATYVEIVQASRNAVRAAVISEPDQHVAQIAAEQTTRVRPVTVEIDDDGTSLIATVTARYALPLPLPTSLRPRVAMTSRTTMLKEPFLVDEFSSADTRTVAGAQDP